MQAEKIKALNIQIVELKTKTEIDHQKSRENNLEMSGLPNSIDDSCLEITCIDILGKVGVNVTEHGIEACHRLPTGNRDKPVIVKFVNRKSTEKAVENARNLNNMDPI